MMNQIMANFSANIMPLLVSMQEGTGGNGGFSGVSIAHKITGAVTQVEPIAGAILTVVIFAMGVRMFMNNGFGNSRGVAEMGPQMVYVMIGAIITAQALNISSFVAGIAG